MPEASQNHSKEIRNSNGFSGFARSAALLLFLATASSASFESDAATFSTSSNADLPSDNVKKSKKEPETDAEMFGRLADVLGEYEKVKTDLQLNIFKSKHEFALKQFLELFKMRLKFFTMIFDKTKSDEARQEVQDYKRFIKKIEEILKTDSNN